MRPASLTSPAERPVHEKPSMTEMEWDVKTYYWRERYGSNGKFRGAAAIVLS
jgi:hypothetical protein